MSRRERRNHTPALKAKVALAAIKGDRTIAQLAEQFDVHPNQVTSWKAQLEGGAAETAGGGSGIRTHDTVSRIHAFQACALSHSAIPPKRSGARNIVAGGEAATRSTAPCGAQLTSRTSPASLTS